MRRAALVILGTVVILACTKRESTTTATFGTTDTVATATSTTAPPPPDEYKLDHYKFWKVVAAKPLPSPIPVSLKGQFENTPWPASLVSIEYLGNPAEKIVGDAPHAPIRNERLHYVAYAIKSEKQRERQVRVTNQFAPNGEDWHLGSPAWLLTPADKQLNDNTQPPPPGDHFVCYAVIDGKPFPKKVTLIDQFDRLPGGSPETIDTLTPKYLCVPVEKTFKEREPIQDQNTHLAIYELKPPKSQPITVHTQDQFGRQQLKVDQESRYQYLGVPSHKLWKQTQ